MRRSERGKTALTFGSLAVAAVAFEFALLATNAPLSPSGPIAALLDRSFENFRAGPHGAPGVQIAIVRGGEIAYRYAGGFADLAAGARVDAHTRFRAGSITKMLTAICAMQLVEAGRLDLDAPVAKYFAEAPHASQVTVRELLEQTSGLPNYTDLAFSTGVVESTTTPDGILTPMDAQPLDFAPGARYEYSNTNFVVLGRVIEVLGGRPLAQIEREQILVPAGMAESSFAGEAATATATGYDDAAGTKATPAYASSWLYGTGDLTTTADDLARFDIALMNDRFVTAGTLAKMVAPLHDVGDGREVYGLGFTMAPFGFRTLAGHHGGIPGFEADDEMVFDAKFAVVILGNSASFATSGPNNIVLASLWPTDFALAEIGAIHSLSGNHVALDPAIERKARAFLAGVSEGTVDRSTLSPRMSDSFTASAIARAAAKLPQPDTLRTMSLLSHAMQGDDDVYYLTAVYGTTSYAFQFVFDEDGRIADFSQR